MDKMLLMALHCKPLRSGRTTQREFPPAPDVHFAIPHPTPSNPLILSSNLQLRLRCATFFEFRACTHASRPP
jgi:hypothetical protein